MERRSEETLGSSDAAKLNLALDWTHKWHDPQAVPQVCSHGRDPRELLHQLLPKWSTLGQWPSFWIVEGCCSFFEGKYTKTTFSRASDLKKVPHFFSSGITCVWCLCQRCLSCIYQPGCFFYGERVDGEKIVQYWHRSCEWQGVKLLIC